MTVNPDSIQSKTNDDSLENTKKSKYKESTHSISTGNRSNNVIHLLRMK